MKIGGVINSNDAIRHSSFPCPFFDRLDVMKDPRYTALANLLVHHSMRVQPDEKVLIEAFDIPADFTAELVNAVGRAGGLPLVSTYNQQVLRAMYQNSTEEQMSLIGSVERTRMEAGAG